MKILTPLSKKFEFIIIGSGPAGATIGRELSMAGKNVLMIEKGKRHETFGFPFGFGIQHKWGSFKSREGVFISRGITVGGSSVIYNANVYNPPRGIYRTMGIDFAQEVEEVKKEIGVHFLPEEFFEGCHGGTRLREAAGKLGFSFSIQGKFIKPEKCRRGCDMCLLGCPHGAKWTSRDYVDEAIGHGMTLIHSTPVDSVVIEKNKAVGVRLSSGEIIGGEHIIIAAGGIGTAEVLLRSGIDKAGKEFFTDPMDMIIGFADNNEGGAWNEMSFSHAIEDLKESEGFIIGNISALAAVALSFARLHSFRKNFYRVPLMKRGIGLFVKLADSSNGTVFINGDVSKPMTETDRKKMKRGIDLAREIMIKAGIRPASLTTIEAIAGHPGGTAAMGTVVDKNFRTEHENLYVCDGSVIPESPGVPPALTILGMAKYFSKILLGRK